jgi:hypothetical protein
MPEDYETEATGDETTRHAPLEVVVVAPVRVQERLSRSWATQPIPVSESPTRVSPLNVFRAGLRLFNAGAVTVFIAPRQNEATASQGFPVPAGTGLVLDTVDEVWACVAAGQSATLHALAQHLDG